MTLTVDFVRDRRCIQVDSLEAACEAIRQRYPTAVSSNEWDRVGHLGADNGECDWMLPIFESFASREQDDLRERVIAYVVAFGGFDGKAPDIVMTALE